MEDIKTNFIRNNSLLYIFTAVVVSVIIIFSINTIYAEENDKKPLDLWENNSLLSKDEDKKKELNSVSTNNIMNSEKSIPKFDIKLIFFISIFFILFKSISVWFMYE